MLEPSSSMVAVCATMLDASLSMVAFKSATSALPVLISYCTFLDSVSHHSAYSAYVFCTASPSPMILDSRSPIIWMILAMGLAATEGAATIATAAIVFMIAGVIEAREK